MRTTLAFVMVLASGAILVQSSGARDSSEAGAVPRLAFPLIAKTDLWDNYGDPRPNGSHAGIDMENAWRAPVVAVEPGRVEYADSILGGCMLYLYGRSKTMYMYIHLNNDLGPRNDNKGRCAEGIAFAVPNGASVLTGEQIGFVGDSGDATGNPHLHFEVHPNGGTDVSPFPHLKKATKLLFAAREGARFSLALRGRLVATGDANVRIAATSVRTYPGGRWLEIDERTVDLAVPADAALTGTQAVAAFKAPARVAVYTTKARVTKDALMGVPGALSVGRVTALAP